MKRRKAIKIVIWCASIFVGFSAVALCSIAIAHSIQFRRADYKEYDAETCLLYSDLDENIYPREKIEIPSGQSMLTGYLYNANSTQGIIIISPGHRDPNDIKLYEITYFVDAGWMVLCYDYTGCYNSEGNSMTGYTQSVHDLDAVLNYIETGEHFKGLPIMLFGHSLGAYASAAVLHNGHNVVAAIIASGFDTPKEQWQYSIERYTGVFHSLLLPYTNLFISMRYGNEANLSALDGINSTNIPILVISGTNDIYYGGESPIYKERESITNANCTFRLMEESQHNGHYDYFLTDASNKYRKQINNGLVEGSTDKELYLEHDADFMNYLNMFYLSVIDNG